MADYIPNAAFTAAIAKYRKECMDADEKGLEHPPIPNEIAGQFLLLANKISYRPNFVNYSYREDMVAEGALACCAKILNFDTDITTNAFGYFSRIVWYAFLEVIDDEKTKAYVKAKSYYNMIDEHGNPFEYEDEDEHDIQNDFIPYFDVEEFERKDKEKRAKIKDKKRETTVIEDMIEDGNNEENQTTQ